MPEFDEQWLRDTFTQQPQKEVANVERLIDHAVRLSESGAVPEARATLAPLAPLADELVEDNVRLAKIVDSALKMLRKSERLSRMFADAVKALVDVRADLYQAEGEFRQAARLLQSVDVSTCELTPAQQLLHVLRATQFFLAAEDFAGATMTLKQAQRLINKVPESEAAVHVLFASCYARVADNERRFLDAALRYMSLSQYDSSIVPQQDALDSLERAITCTILAKAGPRRDRVLAMLVRDDRASKLANSNMLFAVHHGRIIQVRPNYHSLLLNGFVSSLAGGNAEVRKDAASAPARNAERWTHCAGQGCSGAQLARCQSRLPEHALQGHGSRALH
ncbi:MAG: hypothetical protein MHM6MM_001411 [Cercozoa sp. M6MM]